MSEDDWKEGKNKPVIKISMNPQLRPKQSMDE